MPKLASYSFALALLLAACSAAELSTPRGGGGAPTGTSTNPAEDEDPDAPASGKDKKKTPSAGDDDDDDTGEAPPDPQPVTLRMTSAVTIQVQPVDSGAAILAAIKGAKKSVHMTMYLLTDTKVIAALGDAKDGGRDVKVVLNKSFPTNGGSNTAAFDALTARGVDVVWSSATYRYTHAKTILIDGEKAIVMTMNLTPSSPKTNREYIATDVDPADVADLEKVFAADRAGEAVSLGSKLVLSPDGTNTNGAPRDFLRAFIDSAQTSLDVEVQTLSDRSLVDGILAAHKAGKDVHVVIDGDVSTTNAQLTVISKLKQAGVPLKSLKTPDLHAKVIVVDGAKLFVGSQNFTATALDDNREVGIFTDAAAEAAKVKTQIASDFTKGVEL
ncbi:MAG: hypothetical protein KIT84_18130 [Labilithrix sp.]|nr:hypothetical protein [Labilithrix sp.]MCW5812952.1 hypothetical protein [Labilithrix sp.]